MQDKELRAIIDEHVGMIPYSKVTSEQASKKATAFLVALAILTDEKRGCDEDKAKLSTLVSASYAQALSRSMAKQVTEKKVEAEQDNNYTKMREALEECEAKISWLKNYMNIFENAHVTYRQLSKE